MVTNTPPDPKTRLVVANVSGGKDSTALSLHLTELGIEHKRVFADTGWEHKDTYEYLDYLETVLGPIDRVYPVLPMADLIRKKGRFPSRLERYCTTELKIKPINQYMAVTDPEWRAIVVLGIRHDESSARASMPEWEHDGNNMERWTWRPLIHWTIDDVVAIHKRHGVRPNPLYVRGAERVGCWPCIYARKAEVRMVAEESPERIAEIRQLEADMAAFMEVKKAASDEYRLRAEEKQYRNPTFFNHGERMEPIDTVVAWSKTVRGGKDKELFYSPPSDGCMRWGMCETPEGWKPADTETQPDVPDDVELDVI